MLEKNLIYVSIYTRAFYCKKISLSEITSHIAWIRGFYIGKLNLPIIKLLLLEYLIYVNKYFPYYVELIPRPARSCEDPPLYLRLRTGRPKDKKIPRSTPIMSYGKKKLRPEYWFSVPRNR